MNEDLIEKLDDLAFEFAMSSISYGGENFSDIQRGKFAELLIRECINEIHGADLGDLPATSYYLDKVAEHLEKHFGLNDD